MIRGVFVNAIIIRFEGPLAVCRGDDKSIIEIKRFLLPMGTEEGDVLEIKDDKVSINVEETARRKRKVESLFEDILS